MFMSNPDIDLCLKVYNLPETEFIQKMVEITLPKIKTHQVVYLPMIDEVLTVENLEKLAEDYQAFLSTHASEESKIEPKSHYDKARVQETKPEFSKSPKKVFTMESHYTERLHSEKNPMYLTKSVLYRPEKQVMVRILSPVEFPVDWKNRLVRYDLIDQQENKTSRSSSFFKSLVGKKKKIKPTNIPNEEKSSSLC